MTTKIKSVESGLSTLSKKPFYLDTVNGLNRFHHKQRTKLTQAEKIRRDQIFRVLILELQNARFERSGDFLDLVFDIPKLPHSKNFGSLETSDLKNLGVCFIPKFILNALVCGNLAKRFGDLTVCGCFVEIDKCWRLDVDENLSRNGVFLPVRERSSGLIYGLKVFRYPDDQKPFLLRTRGLN